MGKLTNTQTTTSKVSMLLHAIISTGTYPRVLTIGRMEHCMQYIKEIMCKNNTRQMGKFHEKNVSLDIHISLENQRS